ncbi:MAG: OmpH family outer membrane protein [Ketobacteraceae bacterium]|nr:OmpH family outer membrane protein [Ketobacteraceae bacterium]
MKQFKILTAVLLTMLSFSTFAAGKIAVVNVQEAITKSDKAKMWLEKFEAEHATEQADLRVLESELQAMQERFKKDQAILSEEEKRKSNKSMQDKYEELQFRGKQLQNEFKEAQQELLKSMLPKVQAALNKLMEKNGYDVILRSEVVLSLSPKLDITEQVIDQLNKDK